MSDRGVTVEELIVQLLRLPMHDRVFIGKRPVTGADPGTAVSPHSRALHGAPGDGDEMRIRVAALSWGAKPEPRKKAEPEPDPDVGTPEIPF